MVYFRLTPDAFYAYTPLEFDKLLVIKNIENKNSYIIDMEVMRLQTFHLVNMQIAVKDRYKTLESFMPFDWEDERESGKQDTGDIEMTEADWEALDNQFPANKLKSKN